MADESQRDDATEQDDSKGEETEATTRRDGDKGGDDDKPGAALLAALNKERERAEAAERELKKRQRADRDAETARAIKAGEFETVLKAKDTEIAELTTRIADLEGQIASARLETVRERVAAKHKLPPALAARLQGSDEASLEADAKELAKLVVVRAPNTETSGNNAGGGKPNPDQEKQAQIATGRYSAIA